MRDGEVYERLEDPSAAPDRVEYPHGYQHFLGQLKAMEKMARHHRRRSHRPVVRLDQGPDHRVEDRKREDRYYRDREEKSRPGKIHEKAARTEQAEIVVETARPSGRSHDDKDRSTHRRYTHSSKYRGEEAREGRKGEPRVREERPHREREHRREERPYHVREYRREERPHHENKYRYEDKHGREQRSRPEKDVDVEIQPSGREQRYKTRTVKPDKEHRKSYYL